MTHWIKRLNTEQASKSGGFTMTELLVGLFMSATLLAVASTDFLSSERHGFDERIRNKTQQEARAIYDIISFDLRAVGSGVGIEQDNFTAAIVGDDAPLPVLVGAQSTDMTFRINETGKMTVLTTDFTPSMFNVTFDVFDPTLFAEGDTIYLSNVSRDGTAGLAATIDDITGNTITIDVSYVGTPSTTFEKGTLVQKVSEIRYYQSGSDGVARARGTDISYLGPSSAFSLTYLDANGTALTTPLSQSDIENSLAAVNLSVIVLSTQRLSSGDYYSANVSQRIFLRNLVLARN